MSSLTGPWVTEQRNDAFDSDTGSEAGIFNYLNSIPKDGATGHLTSLTEYHYIIPDFQLYLGAALIESHTETELESFRSQRKNLPSIKTIIADLGLELRDYVRN